MPDLLKSLGVLQIDDFFDLPSCRMLESEMRAARNLPATVSGPDVGSRVVDETERRARAVYVPETAEAMFRGQLLEVKPALEAHFGVKLGEPETPQFLTYHPGGFQVPHKDAGPSEAQREISVVLFVNDRSDEADGDGYAGGSLVLYGLLGSESLEHGIAVGGKSGQLVAFRSDVLHEVKPVTGGERHTAVAWFPPSQAAG
jgi:SM-20-related protein